MLGGRQQQGLGHARIKEVGASVGKRNAIVRRVDHEGVVTVTRQLEFLQNHTNTCSAAKRWVFFDLWFIPLMTYEALGSLRHYQSHQYRQCGIMMGVICGCYMRHRGL